MNSRLFTSRLKITGKNQSKVPESMVKDETETKVNMSETGKDSDFLFRQGDKRANKKEKLDKVLYTRNVHRNRNKVTVEKIKAMNDKNVEGTMFDERIDKTRKEVGIGKSNHKRFRKKKEEHCSVVGYGSDFQGGSPFCGHLVPQEGTGKGLAASLMSFTAAKRLKLDS